MRRDLILERSENEKGLDIREIRKGEGHNRKIGKNRNRRARRD